MKKVKSYFQGVERPLVTCGLNDIINNQDETYFHKLIKSDDNDPINWLIL